MLLAGAQVLEQPFCAQQAVELGSLGKPDQDVDFVVRVSDAETVLDLIVLERVRENLAEPVQCQCL